MTKLLLNVSVACTAFIALAGVSRANLVVNGDFSQSKDGFVVDWHEKEGKGKMTKIPVDGSAIQSEKDESISYVKESAGGKTVYGLKVESKGENGGSCLLGPSYFPLVGGYEYEMSFRYRSEGLVKESVDRKTMVGIICDVFLENDKGRVSNARILAYDNSAGWVTLTKRFAVPAEVTKGQIRFSLSNRLPGAKATIWFTGVKVVPIDPTLPNGGFEKGSAPASVEGWKAQGAGKSAWVTGVARNGKACVSVSDAPDGLYSGWTTDIPVRPDRSYSLSGYVKAGVLNPNGFIGGGAVAMQFYGADGQPLGKPVVSPAVGANSDWTLVETVKAQPPLGATTARLMAILQYTNGTAWFDDLSLSIEQAESKEVVRVKRENPAPSKNATYALNLLANGDVEQGEKDKPAGWTYVGKSTPDWTEAEIAELHTKGRPNFNIGRGQGVWDHGVVYSGKGALLNVSIDPPLAKGNQWRGRNAVDGYWISDPVPCEAGGKYIASAWLRPGKRISSAWYGPLEIRFYDDKDRQVRSKVEPRCPLGYMPPGEWNYYATQPYEVPQGAVKLRLRFGQEFAADDGGWGRTYADNLSVWKLEDSVPMTDYKTTTGNSGIFWAWFKKATEKVKPPYMPSPSEAAEYDNVLGEMENSAPGNVYYDPSASVKVKFKLSSLIGEDRSGLSLKVVCYDSWGKESEPITVKDISLPAYGTSVAEVSLPPTKSYGAYYVDARVYEGNAHAGDASGRYAVLPELKRPHTSENIFGVTLLDAADEKMNYSPERKKEMSEVLRIAGFGVAWSRYRFSLTNENETREHLNDLKEKIEWFRSIGMRTVVQIHPNTGVVRPLDAEAYKKVAQLTARELKNSNIAAFGNWGIEQANSASPYRGGGKDRWTDEEYDTVMAAIYDGIKSENPSALVLTGNIATDGEAKTVRRLYGAPVNGRFDGAVLNAYMGQLTVCQNTVKEFDAHGDKQKTVWQEEMASQRSPHEGEARRYGEVGGAEEMVRVWLTLAGKLHPRIKAVTMWGFANRTSEDIMMMTPNLQPRPQFVAHAIMSDAIADATFVADRSQGGISLFEWKRPVGTTTLKKVLSLGKNETLLVAWSNAGNNSITLEAPAGEVLVMDILGNTREVQGTNGLVTLELTPSPIYISGDAGLAVSKRLESSLSHGDTIEGDKLLKLALKNNDKVAVEGEVSWFVGDSAQKKSEIAKVPFSLKAGESTTFSQKIEGNLPQGVKTSVRAEIRTKTGSVFASTGSFNFAQAVKAAKVPSLDGTWKEWTGAMVIPFGATLNEVNKGSIPDDDYLGTDDILGNLRLMWDDQNLYLGVEALDNKLVLQPQRGRSGFMADSIEFGIQPNGIIAADAPYWEYELYLPGDGKNVYAASRRAPLPIADITEWKATVKPTGTHGNLNYQVAIPWKDLGVSDAKVGKSFTMSVVLNDGDRADRLGGGRKRIYWFTGVDGKKNPMGFGDVTLVDPVK